MDDKVFISSDVHHIRNECVTDILGVIPVEKISAVFASLKLFSAYDLVGEFALRINEGKRHRDYSVPEKVRDPFEYRFVAIDVRGVYFLRCYFSLRKFVAQLVCVINYFSLFQFRYLFFVMFF